VSQPIDPTPAEIRERCLEIQKEWSEHTRHRRLRCDWRSELESLEPVTITRPSRETNE
jgi:hypothetical protein